MKNWKNSRNTADNITERLWKGNKTTHKKWMERV